MSPAAWIRHRSAARRQRDEAVVAGVLLRQGAMSAWPLTQATGLRTMRVYAALARLERDGTVVSDWEDGPYPRRRLYRLAGTGGAHV